MEKEILIAGAGSAGLSAALFLAEQGYRPRILEKRTTPSTITKALGVNPNTLSLFKHTEITQRFLDNGWKCHAMNFHSNYKPIFRNDFSKVKHEFPFMLIQPQFETERIIEEAVMHRGISIERGYEIESVSSNTEHTLLSIKKHHGETENLSFTGIVIGADGHKSRIRESLHIPFTGWEHQEQFTMYDIELDTPLTNKEGHYLFFKEGGMIMLPIRENVWRVGGNIPDVLEHLPPGTQTGRISWETTFTIREKVAATFNRDHVYLLGDAAHIHSPAGAKGMNLCIEDGYIFASLFAQGRENEFNQVRRGKIKKAVGVLGQLTDKVGGQNLIGHFIRSNMASLSFAFPLVMPPLRKFLMGLK